MKNMIELPKVIPFNVPLTNYVTSKLSNIGIGSVYTTPNTAGQYWNSSRIAINSDGVGEGGLQFFYEMLEVADYIEIHCEIRTISGDSPVMKISEYNKNTKEEFNQNVKNTKNTNHWQVVTHKGAVTVNKNWGNTRAFIGLENGKSGVFEVRNLRVVGYTRNQVPFLLKTEYLARLTKSTGAFAINTSTTDVGITLTKNSASQYQLNYPVTPRRPLVLITGMENKNYLIEVSDATNTSMYISFRTFDGVLVSDIDASVPNDFAISILIKW